MILSGMLKMDRNRCAAKKCVIIINKITLIWEELSKTQSVRFHFLGYYVLYWVHESSFSLSGQAVNYITDK